MRFLETVLAPQLSQARERRISGIVTATVKSIEADGTYRLNYLSMGDDNSSSSPARCMMPMAGDKRGMHFLPEVGDEVVVAFENGDPSFPVILGAVWNNDSPVPDQADASPSNNTRTIVSRSGHELTFDDTAAAEKVTLKSKGGHVVELDDAPGAGKVTIKSGLGHAIELDDTPPGKVSIQTSAGVKFSLNNAGGTASMESLSTLTLKAMMIQLEAPAGIILKTSGVPQASLVIIDGSLYSVHTHTTVFGPTIPPLIT